MPNAAVGKPEGFGALSRQRAAGDPTQSLKRACEDFEALFVKQMLDSSRVGPTKEGLFGQEAGSELLWDMHNTYLSEAVSRSRSLGVAKLLLDQLKPLMAAQAYQQTDQSAQ